jgi:hypothetical protein
MSEKSILDSLIKIVFKAEENGFTPDFFEAVKEEIKYVSDFLKLTPLQTAMFSLFLNRCDDNAITTKKIAKGGRICSCKLYRFIRF